MLTSEQRAIIESKGNIKINAVAGSGKTTTLIEYARARPGEKILYLAFNRTVKLEAERKFAAQGLANVRVETAHSLAYGAVVRPLGYQVKSEGYKSTELVELLQLANFSGKHTEYVLATHINALVAMFCNSDKARVQELDYEGTITDSVTRQFVLQFREEIVQQTRILLDKMNRGEIGVIHDFYLKKFQLSEPVLRYDSILFDEGQDASEVILDIFLSQPATKVIVGDSHQQIYGWRYAVNSLEKVDYPTYHLSQSFRFEGEIARLARCVVGWKRHLKQSSALKIEGVGKAGKVKTRAVIARTNAGLLVKAIELLIEKKEIESVYFEGRVENYTYAGEGASIYDVLNLYNGEKSWIRDKMMAGMKDMDELDEYIENTGDAQLRMLVGVVKEYGNKIPGYIKKLKESHLSHDDKEKADMIFSTVHRCKGMEYDEVTLADDFITEEGLVEQSAEASNLARLTEEVNLLYVAITRTRTALYIPEDLLPEETSERNLILGKHSRIYPVKKAYSAGGNRGGNAASGSRAGNPAAAHRADGKGIVSKGKNAYAPWTDDEDNRMMKLFYKGKSPKELAVILGRTSGAIAMRIKKLQALD